MDLLPVNLMLIILVLLLFISGFFSGSETGMMSLNRYRLRHLARKKHRSAALVSRLLERTDRLLGVILIGNTIANVLVTSLGTALALHWFGDLGVAIAWIPLTLIVFIFAEVTPKTLAALYPQSIAFYAARPLNILLKILYPIVWLANVISNGLLRLLGFKLELKVVDELSAEELRTVVREAGNTIPVAHQTMLLSILSLEKVTVEDIMIPRNEIIGIEMEDEWEEIATLLTTSQHTRLPIYQGGIDNVIGMIHLREVLHSFAQGKLNKETLSRMENEVYFVPEGTPLNTQLLKFREQKQRSALVVDEYGDIQGLITIEDILEEIVGEFTTDLAAASQEVHLQKDGSYFVDGGASIRDLNRSMDWNFSTRGPKTLSGLITEYLGSIPRPGTCMLLDGYPVEVIRVHDNMVKTARVQPLLRKGAASSSQ